MTSNAALTGRKAIITGAGKGIGEAIARQFATEGAEVVLVARTASDLERVASEIRVAGGVAHCVPADMGDATQVKAVVDKAAAVMRGIDIVVSNAAAVSNTVVMETSLEDWSHVHQVNVVGTLALLKSAFSHLSGRAGSSVLIVSSIQGLSGTPTTGAYGASKAALNHMTRTLAVEWGPVGIRVNAILPGPVLTPQMEKSIAKFPIIKRYENCAPLKGWSLPDDIAAPAVFLSSAAAKRITGHLLVVDGGLVAHNQDCLVCQD
jgi:NAD(P)-dependent dehydrogenase (short-subunit alcohol dehydrogenase family)